MFSSDRAILHPGHKSRSAEICPIWRLLGLWGRRKRTHFARRLQDDLAHDCAPKGIKAEPREEETRLDSHFNAWEQGRAESSEPKIIAENRKEPIIPE